MKTLGKYLLLGAMLGAAGTTYAQDAYDAQTFASKDLNGTSRFVAMGGALGALGGDLSVMSTNPAGTAMYRRSDAAITISELFTGKGAMNHDGYRMSLDQGGILVAFDMDSPSSKGLQFVNFGVNFQKKRNFLTNQRTDVLNLNNTFSQTFQIADLANWAMEDARIDGYNYDEYFGTLPYLGTQVAADGTTVLLDKVDEDGNPVYDSQGNAMFDGMPAKKAYFERATYGANVQADVNLSFNVSDQFFFGLSFGVYDMDYNRESFYQEVGADGNQYDFTNWYKTTGDGFDVKLGFIVRPVEDSPFRVGLIAHTPTWYTMRDANGAVMKINSGSSFHEENSEYEYRFRTPWTLGISLGHTIGNFFAIGAEYEFQDPSTSHYTELGFNGEDYEYFRNMNRITEQTLKAQHTLKVGVEYKPIEEFAIRMGYNYVSSPFKNNAFRTIGYDGVYTETDYTNWGDTHRFTFGVGYRYKGGYFDLSYQYQGQKGDFYAFDNENLKPTKIENNRHQVMGTLGFRF